MTIPHITQNTELNDWSSTWLIGILESDQDENFFYDFKEGITSLDPAGFYNIQKTVSSFANTFGGFIIFGVKDKGKVEGLDRLIGIRDQMRFSKELTDKLSGGKIVPNVFYEGPKIIQVAYNSSIYEINVIKVPASDSKPHAVVKDGLLNFWMRGNASAVAATYPELIRMIEGAEELKNLVVALLLDTVYIDAFADQILIPEEDRNTKIPLMRITSLMTSDQITQIISKLSLDVSFVALIWQLRQAIDIVNCLRDSMLQRRNLPLTNNNEQNKSDNEHIANTIPNIKNMPRKFAIY